jgi:hypothetical protein
MSFLLIQSLCTSCIISDVLRRLLFIFRIFGCYRLDYSIKRVKTGKTPLTYRENRLPSPQIAPYNKNSHPLYEILCNPLTLINLPKRLGKRSPPENRIKRRFAIALEKETYWSAIVLFVFILQIIYIIS